ncbi:MAG: restriction endonuclease subunit S [Candidatus Binatia bacterium]
MTRSGEISYNKEQVSKKRSGILVSLSSLLTSPPQNGYSPVCPATPTGKWILGLSTLSDNGLDLSQAKPAPADEPLVDRFQLYPGDFLISRSNTLDKVGRVALYRGGLEKCSYPDLMMRFRIDPTKVDSDYLEAYLRSEHVVKYLQHHATGTSGSMKKINQATVEAIPIFLPSLLSQQKIASILSTWDAAIEKTERLIAAKERLKVGLMQQLLTGKHRLKGFKNTWTTFHLGELFSERNERGNDYLPLLSITREEGVISRDELDRRDTSSEDKSSYLRICPGDIGYNTMRMWQGVSALSQLEGIVSPAYTICIPKEQVHGKFMAYLFKLPQIIHLFYRYSQGLTSDTWNLKFHHFVQIKVRIPAFAEQAAIAAVLETADTELKVLRQQKSALERQKRGLMQKLLTGQWRVKAADTEAA